MGLGGVLKRYHRVDVDLQLCAVHQAGHGLQPGPVGLDEQESRADPCVARVLVGGRRLPEDEQAELGAVIGSAALR